jgi:hypothetical protein
MAAPLNGSCLCGTVRFEVQPPFERMVHCHCSRCRKATGTGHATNLYVQPSQLQWLSGEASITRYSCRRPGASENGSAVNAAARSRDSPGAERQS